MLWRHWLSKKSRQVPQGAACHEQVPLGVMLEARMLFDGAVAATVETAVTQNTATQTAASTDSGQSGQSTTDTTSHNTDATSNVDTTAHNTDTQNSKTVADSSVAVATGSATHKEVVFIDTAVADYQQLARGVKDGVEVVLLDADKDGLSQIMQWAQTHTGYDAIHIISNGGEGRLTLGGVTLTDSMLATRSAALTTIGQSLTESGDILLYGCNVAQGTQGQTFISNLAALTGADVAASTDLTGSTALKGDWMLESQVGQITTDIAITAATQRDYTHVLDTFTFETGTGGGGGNNQTWQEGGYTLHFDFVGNVLSGLNSDGNSLIYDVQTDGSSSSNSLTFTISIPGYVFDLSSLDLLNADGTGNMNYTISSSKSTSGDNQSGVLPFPGSVSYTTISGFNGNFVGVSSITITTSGTNEYYLDNLVLNNIHAASSVDATSTVTAGPSGEATTFSTTATSAASATSLLDFTLTDLGTSDGSATNVSQFYANVSGTATSSELSKMTFLLSGPDATNVVGTYDSSTGRITFSSLNLSVADNSSETYTIKAYYNDNTSSNDITDHHTVILSVNASNFTTVSGGSTFASSQANVNNGSGASIDVAATKLIYSQSPSTSVVSGINFTTQPVVIAVDDRGNIDTDFNGSVTLSENGSGSLTGTTQATASNGIATFSGVKYTSASDGDANFVLTAAAGSLVSATSASLNPDVVATRLVFSTQPVPTAIQNGQSAIFTTVPVVQAVDANGMVDQDYTTNIVLSVTDPNDSVVDGTVNSLAVTSGDNDASATTVTLTPSGGIATYTGLIIQYTNSGSINTLALRATSGSLTAVNSSSITSTTNTAPVFSNLNGGATFTEKGSAVVMDSDVTVADTELDIQGNYNGASVSIARNGGANSVDTFGNSGLLGALTQGQNFTYNGTTVGSVTANSSGTLTLTFNSNATAAIVNAVLQSLTYANSSDDPPSSVTLNWTFNDGSLNSSGTNQAVLSITPVNDAPVISNTSVSKTFNEDSAQTFSVADFGFSDVDSSDTLQSITIVTAPTAGELFIDANNDGVRGGGDTLLGNGSVVSAADISKLTFRPTANANGAGYASFTWQVSDGTALSSNTGTMTLNVTPVNDAPIISNTSVSKTINEDSAQTFSAADFGFSDVDNGDTLQSITIVTAPTAGELFIDANNDGVRGGGDTLLGNGSVVSAADISKLIFRPTANANGTGYASFTWQVSDGTALSANTGTMTLNVTPVNDAPTLSSGATVTLTSTTEDVTSSATTVSSLLNSAGYGDVDSGASSGIAITATVGNGGWQYSTDSGANWFNIGTVSSSAALLLGSTAQLRYVPDSANGETATLSFSAWDQTSGTATAGSSKGLADTSTSGGSSAFSANSAQASLMVTSVNDAPSMGSTVSPQSATKDTVFSFAVPAGTFVDVDSGDTLTLSATLADGSALPAWLSFNPSTRTFSGTPGYSDVGNLTIRITATDGSNASVSTTFGLTVNNSNLPPVVSIPMDEQSIAQNGSFNFTVPAGTFTDPDIGDTLTLSAKLADGSALPAWLSFEPATRTFSGTPGNGDVGNLTIRVTATDGSNASVSTTFGLVVTNVNDAPVIGATIAPQSIAQDGSLSFTVPAGTFVDPDGDPLTLSATLANGNPLPAWLHFDPATGSFSGTPGNADVGNLNIRITASDGSASVSTSFSLMVTNVNDAPVLSTPIPPQSVAQDGSFNLTVPAGTFVDPDGDTLTLSATQADGSALPAWLRFDPAKGSFSGTPGNADIGSLVIRVTATDAGNTSISTTFSLTVTRAGITSGDPQFRISDGTNGPRPVDSQTPTIQPQEAAAPPLNILITPASLGSFNAGRTAGSGSMMASIFGASSDGASGRDATKSEVANVFGPGSSFGSHFESSLGSFPSFNKDPALGGSSSLASVFSGIYLPSLTPMEVFTGGSWKDINLHAQGVTEQGQEQATAAFIPSFHRQLQHIGDAEGQRLSAIEQALYDLGQQQG
ncbi:hypothetical protein CWM66_06445 [Kosakonia sp. H7A]|uniref:putative Ig domain-containing protein n=1 Tax=Kosakonia sp. H7A TaxID=2054598 RepID=UPI000D17CAA5|nr:putative Ig domain-containing protein [Kosakonia sp. H7A]PTA93648.1 hypothetical protein CWM66_06445 [Kosakonia sp. H7A]